MPIEDKDNLNLYLNNMSKNLKKPKLKNINIKIKNIIDKYLIDYKDNFDSYYRKFNFYTKDNYILKYNVCSLTKEFINLKYANTNFGVSAKLYIYKDNLLAFPDEEGNIINEESNKKNFISEAHKIPEKFHKSYIRDFIYKNFSNLTKNEIFNGEENNSLLIEYCKQFFINNPDISTCEALNQLAKKCKINYNEEIANFFKAIKIGKQFQYNNKLLLNDYISLILKYIISFVILIKLIIFLKLLVY